MFQSVRWSSLLCLLLAGTPAMGASVDLASSDVGAVATDVAVGDWLTITGVQLERGSAPATLELQRFDLFAPGARIVVHGDDGETTLPPPDNRYFRGFVDGAVSARAVVSVLASGEIRGLVLGAGRYWMLANRLDGERLTSPRLREIDYDLVAERASTFECGVDRLGNATDLLHAGLPSVDGPAGSLENGGPSFAATVAVDSDFEFFNLFGNVQDTADYMADMIAYSTLVYSDEADTSMAIGELSVWTTAADPWNEFSTVCGLFEFGRYWNDNQANIERTIAHFMSGKNNGGGVAWVGVLCQEAFDYDTTGNGCSLSPAVDNYGGDYGYSGTMDGNFDLGNPVVVWDVVVTAHEMGHNFNSPHTHCYNGIGDPSPVDECFGNQGGCYSGATSLPSGCPGSGMGCGTIMSYCHLLSGGIANIGWTLGLGHPYGTLPQRVPSRMKDFVNATNAVSPNCMPLTDQLFGSRFETGDTSEWDQEAN